MNSMKAIVTGGMLSLGLLVAGGQPAHALQAVWDSSFTPAGWTRGTTPDSHYAEWNIFNDTGAAAGIQDNTPEVGNFGGGSYQVQETTGGAFLTSGGNIYGPTVSTAFSLTISGLGGVSSDTRDVYLSLGSLGNSTGTPPQSFTNFLLNGLSGSYSHLHNEAITGGFGGDEVEALVFWDNVPNASLFTLTWNAVGTSVSLDQLRIDVGPAVAAVPVPAAAYLMASGLVGLVGLARRKQQRV